MVFCAEVKGLENGVYFGRLLAEISRFASLPNEAQSKNQRTGIREGNNAKKPSKNWKADS